MAERPARALPTLEQPERLAPPSPAAVMQVAFALAKELSLDLGEEDLVSAFARALERLLPGRRVCLRVVDPRTVELTALHADGPLAPVPPDSLALAAAPLELKRSALRQTHLPEAITASQRVRLVDVYRPLFAGSQAGFSVPLVASRELFGLCNIEYVTRDDEVSAADEELVIPLANQLSVALRNLSLFEEARYYRDYLRQMIDVANALIVVIGRDGRIAVMNAAMQRYLGVGPDVIGTPADLWRRRSAGSEQPTEVGLATLLLDGLTGREYTDREVVLHCGGGALRRALFNTSILHARDGSIAGVIAVGQDRERVRSLERQVIQAEKLATLGQLAAGVVHELNNPLTSISVYGDHLVRLCERSAAPGDLEKARKVVEGAARIQKLTRDLMSYARPSGEMESVSANEVVRQALVFCDHVLKGAGVRVEVDLAEGLPRVRAIRTQLHQVLINLITNAVHAQTAPEGTVFVRSSLLGADELAVEVSDTGAGIAIEDQEHIFDPFFTTKTEGKGTGLGLSIVKNIVEGHRGRVVFQSRPGEGTTFQIILPVENPKERSRA